MTVGDSHHNAIASKLSTLDEGRAALLRQRLERLRATVALTSTQEGIWLAERLEPGRSGYHDVPRVRLRGPLDRAALEGALADVQRQHEALRCRLMETDEGLRQSFDAPAAEMSFTDLSRMTRDAADQAVERLTAADALRPFRLEDGPLYRTRLVRLTETEHVLVLVIHHLVTDGHSHGVLLSTLGEAYLRRLHGAVGPVASQQSGYRDWVRSHNETQRTAAAGGALRRARQRLAGAPTRLELPGLSEPSPNGSRHTSRTVVPLTEEDWRHFGEACRSASVTRFTALLGTFTQVCVRLAATDGVVVAIPVSQRDADASAELVGCMVDRIPVRLGDLRATTTVEAWLQARSALAHALEDRFVAYATLARDRPASPSNDDPITNIGVQENNAPTVGTTVGDLEISPLPRAELRVRHDLVISIGRERPGDVELQWPSDRWEDHAVARIADGLAEALRGGSEPGVQR